MFPLVSGGDLNVTFALSNAFLKLRYIMFTAFPQSIKDIVIERERERGTYKYTHAHYESKTGLISSFFSKLNL